jgi:hypothetical protein
MLAALSGKLTALHGKNGCVLKKPDFALAKLTSLFEKFWWNLFLLSPQNQSGQNDGDKIPRHFWEFNLYNLSYV